jgi:uncharacterized protein YaiI (UPF0178 family)
VKILIDADGCPVKDEVYRVAKRCALAVRVVANRWMQTPTGGGVEMVVVGDGFDAADDWIVEHADADDIVVTSDILLASRALKKTPYVLDAKGRRFDDRTIGGAVAARALSAHLRESGLVTGGPAPMSARDRSKFLQALDQAVQEGRRGR